MKNFDIYIEDRPFNKTHTINLYDGKNINIFLNKGTSFGSEHDTTILAIDAIKYLYEKFGFFSPCLDLGSGSGILSIFMDKLGFKEIFAAENDPHSRKESELNFNANSINKTPIFIDNPFDLKNNYNLVVCNISGNFIPNNMNNLCDILKPNGYLIISGFNIEKKERYIGLSKEKKLLFIKEFSSKPWISLIFKKF